MQQNHSSSDFALGLRETLGSCASVAEGWKRRSLLRAPNMLSCGQNLYHGECLQLISRTCSNASEASAQPSSHASLLRSNGSILAVEVPWHIALKIVTDSEGDECNAVAATKADGDAKNQDIPDADNQDAALQ
eukprot:1166455-Amphidinium_carterae.2